MGDCDKEMCFSLWYQVDILTTAGVLPDSKIWKIVPQATSSGPPLLQSAITSLWAVGISSSPRCVRYEWFRCRLLCVYAVHIAPQCLSSFYGFSTTDSSPTSARNVLPLLFICYFFLLVQNWYVCSLISHLAFYPMPDVHSFVAHFFLVLKHSHYLQCHSVCIHLSNKDRLYSFQIDKYHFLCVDFYVNVNFLFSSNYLVVILSNFWIMQWQSVQFYKKLIQYLLAYKWFRSRGRPVWTSS